MGKDGIKGEEKIGRVGEGREGNNVNSKRGWKERMKKEDRGNAECISLKRKKRMKEWWENEEK